MDFFYLTIRALHEFTANYRHGPGSGERLYADKVWVATINQWKDKEAKARNKYPDGGNLRTFLERDAFFQLRLEPYQREVGKEFFNLIGEKEAAKTAPYEAYEKLIQDGANYNMWRELRVGGVGPDDWDAGFIKLFHPYTRRASRWSSKRHQNELSMLDLRAVAGVGGHPTMDGLLKMLMLFVETAAATPAFVEIRHPNLASQPCMLWVQVQEMKKDIDTLKRWIQAEQAEPPPGRTGSGGVR